MMPHALVLAGTRAGETEPVAAAEGVARKALVDVAGMPMLARVMRALRAAGIEHIALSADHPEVQSLGYAFSAIPVAAQRQLSASVAAGLAELGPPLLVVTGDHALLRPELIVDFISRAPAGADVCVLLARRAAVEAAAPGTRRTWLRFADGDRSGCNVFLFNTAQADRIVARWAAFEAQRKRPWRIARQLGLGMLVRYLTGRLTLARAAAEIEKRFGATVAFVETDDGHAAIDVDKPGDLALVRAILSG